MTFIANSQCPKCAERGDDRSKNNLAEYSDNFYCWKCGYTKQKRTIESYLKRLEPSKPRSLWNGITKLRTLPTDAKKWLLGYQLTDEEMKQFIYATEREYKGQNIPCELLLLLITDSYWLGRNFGDGVKYLSSGVKPCKKYGTNPDILVFVEDVISAVKVGRVATAIPMLGSSVLPSWWDEAIGYKRVIIWGDRDKAVDNTKQARRASEILGKTVENIITSKDPKEYNNNDIINYLNINN